MLKIRMVMLIVFAVSLAGCTPQVKVIKNPGCRQDGIRYYRPKPYLLITPAGTTTSTTSVDDKGNPVVVNRSSAGSSDRIVQIQLQYLPDFNEEYAIKVRPGLGNATVDITLQDGWNLTGIDQTVDSQFDENVTAVGGLVGSIASLGAPGGGGGAEIAGGNPASSSQTIKRSEAWQVAASNIPLGYYEAVVGCDNAGRKQMYGWRYVGFMPFQGCPAQVNGSDCSDCHENLIYGIVFERGVMTFKLLGQIDAERNLMPVPVPTGVVEIETTTTYGTPPTMSRNGNSTTGTLLQTAPGTMPQQ